MLSCYCFFKSEIRNKTKMYVNNILAKSLTTSVVYCLWRVFLADSFEMYERMRWIYLEQFYVVLYNNKWHTCINVICFNYRTQKSKFMLVGFFFWKIFQVNILVLAQCVSILSHLPSWIKKDECMNQCYWNTIGIPETFNVYMNS